MRVRPILFIPEMVRAILDGRKTVARKVKYKYDNTELRIKTDKYGSRLIEIQKDMEGETYGKNPDGTTWHRIRPYIEPKPPYQAGDILYVRETWSRLIKTSNDGYTAGKYVYRASDTYPFGNKYIVKFRWYPSIHMPKAAARIWLRVKEVRAERLQAITLAQIAAEGIKETFPQQAADEFKKLWDSTIKKADLARYGWDANPWVWVIEFDRCEKPETEKDQWNGRGVRE